jgi:molybdenum cofactor synthesis domain-containing protein
MVQKEMLRVGILTISDRGSQGKYKDVSGEVAQEVLSRLDVQVVRYDVIPDEKELISQRLIQWADEEGCDIIVTTGGTGLGPRDVTPEATLSVLDRLAPGFVEVIRAESLKQTPHAMLSRAVAGIRGDCLIINLPGNPNAVREGLEAILMALPHAIETLKGRGNG